MYLIYDLIVFLASLLYLPVYALRGRMHADIWMRLGIFKKDFFKSLEGHDVVWIHAVSVGEARAAESLVGLIRAQWPQKRIVVSTVTPTGYSIAKKIIQNDELVFYAPLDLSFIVSRFLKMIKPSLLIIMETELWPNLIRLSKKQGACVAIVNGRISDRSYRHYAYFRAILKYVLRKVDLFCMQNSNGAERIISLGAVRKRVEVTGNIKFDISANIRESAYVAALKNYLKGCLLCIAGSTHDNEEEIVTKLYKSLRKDFNNLRLLIAPRHPERIDKIRRMIKLMGLDALNLSHASGFSSAQIVLVDTIGDLSALYQLCDIAFIGGSLVKKGGHNPIEPALFGKAIIFGKHMENFKEIRDVFINAKAALEIDGPKNLEYELRGLLQDAPRRQELGCRAQDIIDKNKGAAQATFSCLDKMFGTPKFSDSKISIKDSKSRFRRRKT
ncbi:MAG: 3-deoxy-D-manno-octulosonic acid transferase [Candidatus Omnitrophota bacterium]